MMRDQAQLLAEVFEYLWQVVAAATVLLGAFAQLEIPLFNFLEGVFRVAAGAAAREVSENNENAKMA